jgi:hypothetical protein
MRKRELKVDQQVIDVGLNWGIGTIAQVESDFVKVYYPRKAKFGLEVGNIYLPSEYRYLKRYPPLKHKGIRTYSGIYDYCSNKITGSEYSFQWDRVTCRNCLKKRKFIKWKKLERRLNHGK